MSYPTIPNQLRKQHVASNFAMHQISYDMKRRVIKKDHAILLLPEPLRSNLLHYTINFLAIAYFPAISRDISDNLNKFKT